MNTCFSPTAGFCGPNCSPFCIPGTDCFSGFNPYAQNIYPQSTYSQNSFPQNIWGGAGFNAQPFGQWNTPWNQNAYGVNSCGPINGNGFNGYGFNGYQGFNGVAPVNGFYGCAPINGYNGFSPVTGFGGCSPIASNWNTPWTNSIPFGGIPSWGMNTWGAGTQGFNPYQGINGVQGCGVQNWGLNAPIAGGMTSPWSMWNTPFAGTGFNGVTPFNWNTPFGGVPFGGTVPFNGMGFNWNTPFNGVPFFGMPFMGMPAWQGAASTTTGVKGSKKAETEGAAVNGACFPYGFTPFGPFGYFNPAAFCQPCENNRAA